MDCHVPDRGLPTESGIVKILPYHISIGKKKMFQPQGLISFNIFVCFCKESNSELFQENFGAQKDPHPHIRVIGCVFAKKGGAKTAPILTRFLFESIDLIIDPKLWS
jgi:hypothetical protein